MLVFHSHCQMANQMFIYACATSLAKTKQNAYCLSSLGGLKYFKLTVNDYIFNLYKYFWFRFSNRYLSKYQYHHLQDNFIDYSDYLLEQSSNSWFYGYFQGEKYLYENKNQITNRFEIRRKYKRQFQNYFSKIKTNKKIVAVHLRRKDYKDFNLSAINGPNLCLPYTYYRECLSDYIHKEDYQIIFVSDDINEVKNEYKDIEDAIFSENDAIVDFQILMHADILILANSSFSWWGAWLNKNNDKIVYVPRYFLGFKVNKEYPINIIQPNWIQKEVYE